MRMGQKNKTVIFSCLLFKARQGKGQDKSASKASIPVDVRPSDGVQCFNWKK
jgi:hypothetical protein